MNKWIYLLYVLLLSLLFLLVIHPKREKIAFHYPPLPVQIYIDDTYSMHRQKESILSRVEKLPHPRARMELYTLSELVHPMKQEDLKTIPFNRFDSYSLDLYEKINTLPSNTMAVVVSDFNFSDGNPFAQEERVIQINTALHKEAYGVEIRLSHTDHLVKSGRTHHIPVRIYDRMAKRPLSLSYRIRHLTVEEGIANEELPVPQGERVDIQVPFSPDRDGFYLLHCRLRDRGKTFAEDQFLFETAKTIHLALFAFKPSYDVKAIKLFCEKYSEFDFTYRDYFGFKREKAMNEIDGLSFDPGTVVVLFAPPKEVFAFFEKSPHAMVVFPCGEIENIRSLLPSGKPESKAGSLSPGEFSYQFPFVNFKGNASASRKEWRRLNSSLLLMKPPLGATIFHQKGKYSAWFQWKKAMFVGFSPFSNRKHGLKTFEEVAYPLFRYLSREVTTQPAVRPSQNNALAYEPLVALRSLSVMGIGGRIDPHSVIPFPIRSFPNLQYLSWKDQSSLHPVNFRAPAREWYTGREMRFTSPQRLAEDWDRLEALIQKRTGDIQPRAVRKVVPIFPLPIYFALLVAGFIALMFMRRRAESV